MAPNTTHNAEINEVKKEISSNSNTAVNAVENKIPNASNLVKKMTIIQNSWNWK